MTAIFFAPTEASARIFSRKHGYYSYTPSQPAARIPSQPVTNDDFTYPDKGDGKVRVLQTIGDYRYFVIYSVNDEGEPVAEVTHLLKDGQYVALTPGTEIPKTSKVTQTLPGIGTFAFLFKGRKGEIYAERLAEKGLKPFWKILPESDGRYRVMHGMERAHALSAERVRVLENQLNQERNAPDLQRVLRNSQASTAYQRIFSALKPILPKHLLSREAVVDRAGFPATARGTHALISPLDPKRPSVLATSDAAHLKEVDDVVTELRNATTHTIIGRNFLSTNRETLERLRANAYLIAQPGKTPDENMKKARDEIASLPAYMAAGAVVEAEQQIGTGPWADAATRVERAARGGLGHQLFNDGVVQSKPKAIAHTKETLARIEALAVERMRETAYEHAARMQQQAVDAGKKSAYLGFEVDFFNQRQRGVEYAVPTADGKSYVLRNLGRNFADPLGDFVPAKTYGRFNVTLLQKYEKSGAITKHDLYEVGMLYDLYPTQEGEIVYINPARYSEERMKAIRRGLKARYEQNKAITFRDIQDI